MPGGESRGGWQGGWQVADVLIAPALRRRGPEDRSFVRFLAQAFVNGLTVDWGQFFDERRARGSRFRPTRSSAAGIGLVRRPVSLMRAHLVSCLPSIPC